MHKLIKTLAALPLVLTSVVLNPARAAQETSTSPPNNQIDRFLDRVAKVGYLVQEGAVGTVDLDCNYCLGAL